MVDACSTRSRSRALAPSIAAIARTAARIHRSSQRLDRPLDAIFAIRAYRAPATSCRIASGGHESWSAARRTSARSLRLNSARSPSLRHDHRRVAGGGFDAGHSQLMAKSRSPRVGTISSPFIPPHCSAMNFRSFMRQNGSLSGETHLASRPTNGGKRLAGLCCRIVLRKARVGDIAAHRQSRGR
jgi:hypothetical protein